MTQWSNGDIQQQQQTIHRNIHSLLLCNCASKQRERKIKQVKSHAYSGERTEYMPNASRGTTQMMRTPTKILSNNIDCGQMHICINRNGSVERMCWVCALLPAHCITIVGTYYMMVISGTIGCTNKTRKHSVDKLRTSMFETRTTTICLPSGIACFVSLRTHTNICQPKASPAPKKDQINK